MFKKILVSLSILPFLSFSAFSESVEIFDITLPCNHPKAPALHGTAPSARQLAWHRMEFYGFVHFGINTFTGREWGYGNEDPLQFNPANFDAERIAQVFKDGGMAGLIYTAKHHDGFCLWPTKTTEHNITKSTNYKGGKGDIVKDFSEACNKVGIKFGVYCSPWDRNSGYWGEQVNGVLTTTYVQTIFYKQLEELLTNYGKIFELWLDGATGGDVGYYGGANESRSLPTGTDGPTYYGYNQNFLDMVHRWQPDCIARPGGNGEAGWGGNEMGTLAANRLPSWCAGQSVYGTWMGREADAKISQGGWFKSDNNTQSIDTLMGMWFGSVGKGATLLLNVGPNSNGELGVNDTARLLEFKQMRDMMYSHDYARAGTAFSRTVRAKNQKMFGAQNLVDGNIDSFWAVEDDVITPNAVVQLPETSTFDVVRVREEIRLGQRVRGWELDAWINGEWQKVLTGDTIGNQSLLRTSSAVTTDRVRLRITRSDACPVISELSLFKYPVKAYGEPTISRSIDGLVTIAGTTNGTGTIYYTTDGTAPTTNSHVYSAPFSLPNGGNVKACIIGSSGSSFVTDVTFWVSKGTWTSTAGNGGNAIDENNATIWTAATNSSFAVDMGAIKTISGFVYMPRQDGSTEGLTNSYKFEVSEDGTNWTEVASGNFGNIENSPDERTIPFSQNYSARYFRFTGTGAVSGTTVTAAEIGVIVAQ